jgi:hypothetical protein
MLPTGKQATYEQVWVNVNNILGEIRRPSSVNKSRFLSLPEKEYQTCERLFNEFII